MNLVINRHRTRSENKMFETQRISMFNAKQKTSFVELYLSFYTHKRKRCYFKVTKRTRCNEIVETTWIHRQSEFTGWYLLILRCINFFIVVKKNSACLTKTGRISQGFVNFRPPPCLIFTCRHRLSVTRSSDDVIDHGLNDGCFAAFPFHLARHLRFNETF